MPPLLPTSEQSIITTERLRLLSWGYYISGGIGAFFASFLLIYAFMFGAMSFIPESEWSSEQEQHESSTAPKGDSGEQGKSNSTSTAPPLIVFRIFAVGMVCATVAGWTLAGLTVYAGYCIQKRKHRIFTNVMAAYNVIWIPYGTLLGVLTFIAINSAEARLQYDQSKS